MKILVIIDPQNGFCHPNEPMFVEGADRDILRLANFIETKGDRLDTIFVSRDKHNRHRSGVIPHISQAAYWADEETGYPPPLYTKLTLQGTKIIGSDGRFYLPVRPIYTRNHYAGIGAVEYLFAIKKKNHELVIWPDHCENGTFSEEIAEPLKLALDRWEKRNNKTYRTLVKGECPFVEFLSAFKADVVDPFDPRTKLNESVIDDLSFADEVLWSGQALSHCLRRSIEDAFEAIKGIPNWTILRDTTSIIKGYEEDVEWFLTEYYQLGVKLSTTEEWNGKTT